MDNPWFSQRPSPPSTFYVVYEVSDPDHPVLATINAKKATDLMVQKNSLPPENGTYKISIYRLVT